MSKKLIAVAAAAALALTGLVATPATSAVGAFAVAPTGQVAGSGLTADDAYTVNLPVEDKLTVASKTVFRIKSTAPNTTDTVRAVSTGGVKVLSGAAFDALTATTNNTKAGSQDVSVVSGAKTDGKAVFYVYSTSTANGTVTFSTGGNSSTINVKGISPVAYHVDLVTAPAVIPTSGDATFDFRITDAFGNEFTGADVSLTVAKLGGLALASRDGTSWDANRKTNSLTVSGSLAGAASLTVSATTDAVTAFGAKRVFFTTVAVGGTLTETITALTDQVAALRAVVAKRVTKKRFNTLARKWNAANPSSKVKLKR